MNDTNKQNKFFLTRFNEIKNDMSKASLYDVTDILNHYNEGTVMNEDTVYHFQISPIDAACLNERYKTLTGKDHPVFLREQVKVLDEMIKKGEGIQVNGQPTIYQRLKNNLTGEGIGIGIIPTKKGSYIDTFEQIKFDMSKASLEEVQSILNYYDQESVLVDGSVYHFRPSVLEGETLNARYRELTGEDHPTFVSTQPRLLDEKIASEQNISVNGKTIYEQIKNGDVTVENNNHAVTRTFEILNDLHSAELEDVSALLSHYNGAPVLIDGVAHHPLNDPMSAAKLNTRYRELTGQDHPTFLEQTPIVIDGLLKDKDMLVQAGVYSADYFNQLEQMKNSIQQRLEAKNSEANLGESNENVAGNNLGVQETGEMTTEEVKVVEEPKDESKATQAFMEEREKQRELDATVRSQQIGVMEQVNQQIQVEQQAMLEMSDENSMGGRSR